METGLRPLTTGQVLDRSFQIYRRNFVLFAGISAVPQACLLVLQLLLLAAAVFSGGNATSFAVLSGVLGLLILVASLILSSIATAATTFGVSDIYLDKPTSMSSCFRRVKGKIGKVAVTSIELGLRVGLGMILLIIPGLYFMGKWGLAVPAVVLEDIGRKKAFPRSAQLTDGAVGRVLVVYFLTWILIVAISAGLMMVLVLIAPSLTKATGTTASQAMQYLLSAVVNTAIMPVMAIALTVLYYDQRVRKEAFDIENLMALIGEQPAGTAVPAAATN